MRKERRQNLAKRVIAYSAFASAILFGSKTAQAQETVNTQEAAPVTSSTAHARASVQYWHTDRHSNGVYGRVEAGDEDIKLTLDYAGTHEPRDVSTAFGTIDAYGLRLGGGINGRQWGAHAGYRADGTIGDDDLSLRTRVSAGIGYGSDSYDSNDIADRVYAASLGTRIELSMRPPIDRLKFLTFTTGIFGQVFTAIPDHGVNNFNSMTEGDQRYHFISTALSLSEARFGAYVQLDAILVRKEDLTIRARLRHITDSVHWDIGLAVLPYTKIDNLKDLGIDPWELRHTTRGELAIEYHADDLALLLGVFAQNVAHSRTFETPAHRNGLSGGFTIAAQYDRIYGRLEAEFYPEPDVRGFTRKQPSASLLASIGATFLNTEGFTLRGETSLGMNTMREQFTGLHREGIIVTAGISAEFGASRNLDGFYERMDRLDHPIAIAKTREYSRSRTSAPIVQTPPVQLPAIPEEIPPELQQIVQTATGQINGQLGQEQITKLTDLLNGEPTLEEVKTTVEDDPVLRNLIDIQYIERLYNEYHNRGEDALKRGLLTSSNLVLGYAQRNTNLTLILPQKEGITAPSAISGQLERGITLTIAPYSNLSYLMREQNLRRATLIQRGRVHTFRSVQTESYMRTLGHDFELLDDLIRPRFEFRR